MSRLRVALVVLVPTLLVLALWGCGDDSIYAADAGTDARRADATVSDAGSAQGDGAASAQGDGAASADGDAALDAGPVGYQCPPLDTLDGGALGAFAPSNFDPTQLDASAVIDIDLSDVDGGCRFNTDALTLTCAHQSVALTGTSVAQAQDAGPPLAVFAVGAFTIEPGVVVDAWGARPLVIYAQGAIDVEGELRASAGSRLTSITHFGAAYCGSGGGTSGGSYGSAQLAPLLAGRGNGPAAGGGAVQLTSQLGLSLGAAGLIDVNGAGGQDAEIDIWAGASGGAILLEAPLVTVAGDLAANGGGSPCYGGGVLGATSPGVARALGGFGADGGGAGSAGDDPNGQAGGASSCLGGGGAGWITIKTRQCGDAGTLTGVMSPTPKSGCANVLPLAPP